MEITKYTESKPSRMTTHFWIPDLKVQTVYAKMIINKIMNKREREREREREMPGLYECKYGQF